MKRTARVLITKDCPRDCLKCCNKTKVFEDNVRTLDSLENFRGKYYKEIIITGGEPMLYPEQTLAIIKSLRLQCGDDVKLYLYTAMYHPVLLDIFDWIDGIQYSLHDNKGSVDLSFIQVAIAFTRSEQPNSISFRLFVENTMTDSVYIYPFLWDRITCGPMIDECPLPEHEDLFFYDLKKVSHDY